MEVVRLYLLVVNNLDQRVHVLFALQVGHWILLVIVFNYHKDVQQEILMVIVKVVFLNILRIAMVFVNGFLQIVNHMTVMVFVQNVRKAITITAQQNNASNQQINKMSEMEQILVVKHKMIMEHVHHVEVITH